MFKKKWDPYIRSPIKLPVVSVWTLRNLRWIGASDGVTP